MPDEIVTPDAGWIEVGDRASLTYTTADTISEILNDGDYWDDRLPPEYGKGSIIKVNADGGTRILLVTNVTGDHPNRDVTVTLLDVAAVNALHASFSYVAFHGLKWAGPGFSVDDLDNKDWFEIADRFNVPVYVGPGNFYTTVRPNGKYFGEGIIFYQIPDIAEDIKYRIALSATPVNLGTPIEKLAWRAELEPPPALSEEDYEHPLSMALGVGAGASFTNGTTSAVAVGYKALSLATGACDSSTAVGTGALARCAAPINTVAMGAGAMAATTWSDRNTCLGDAAGKWAGCDDPALYNHNFFQANYRDPVTNQTVFNNETGALKNLGFDDWAELDPKARKELVGPLDENDEPLTNPNTLNAYKDHTVPRIPLVDEDDYDPNFNPNIFNENNVYVGRDAGNHNVKGQYNTFVGSHCAHGWNVDRSTFVGGKCGTRALSASDCVGIGAYCLTSNTRGKFNTAGGVYAMASNSFGEHNTAWGANALFSLTGYGGGVTKLNPGPAAAQATNNVAVGDSALTALVYGTGNTALGANALVALTKNNDNTAVGRDALVALTRHRQHRDRNRRVLLSQHGRRNPRQQQQYGAWLLGGQVRKRGRQSRWPHQCDLSWL